MAKIDRVKIAVLGTGSIGLRHLRIINSTENATAVAIPVRASRLSELKADGFATLPCLREAAGDAQAIIIATDTARHSEDALCALSQGFHVLVEKPMAVDATQANRVCAESISLNRQTFVGCVLRFSQALQTFRELLPSVGRLHSVRIECQSYLPDWRPQRPYKDSYSARAEEGGVLLDLIHEIDYAGWLFGWPVSLQASLKNLGRLGIDSDEIAELTWETSKGCIVSTNLDYLSRTPRRQLHAYGELGTICWGGITGTVQLMLAGASLQEHQSAQTRDEMFAAQIGALVDYINGEPDSRMATGVDGVKALAICDAARLSSTSRREEVVIYP